MGNSWLAATMIVAVGLLGSSILHARPWSQDTPSQEARPKEALATTTQLTTQEQIRRENNDRILSECHQEAELRTNRATWTFGLAGQRYSLKSGDGQEILGNSAMIQLGTGKIYKNWYLLGSFDVLLGPFEPTQNQQLNVDYLGTGLSIWVGFSAQTLDLRSEAGGYGFALGLKYDDIIGRSVGHNRLDLGQRTPEGKPMEGNEKLLDTYTMRVTSFSLLPAIFFSWLEPDRPRGTSPELLQTRVEGLLLTIGLAIPIDTSFSVKSTMIDQTDTAQSGRLRGYSIIVSMLSILNT